MRDTAITRQDCVKAGPSDVQIAVPEILHVIGNNDKLHQSCAIDESLVKEGLCEKSNGSDGIKVVIEALAKLVRDASIYYNDARFKIISQEDKRMDTIASKPEVANIFPPR